MNYFINKQRTGASILIHPVESYNGIFYTLMHPHALLISGKLQVAI